MTPSRSTATPRSPSASVVIGIDPGLARTGIGVIRRSGSVVELVDHRVVRTSPASPLSDRLALIHAAVADAVSTHGPEIAAIERTFISDNPASSLALGQARGAALAALGAQGMQVNELAPNAIKKNLTGDALASKAKVANMVRSSLGIPSSTRLANDASDALAIAISCVHQRRVLRRSRRFRR